MICGFFLQHINRILPKIQQVHTTKRRIVLPWEHRLRSRKSSWELKPAVQKGCLGDENNWMIGVSTTSFFLKKPYCTNIIYIYIYVYINTCYIYIYIIYTLYYMEILYIHLRSAMRPLPPLRRPAETPEPRLSTERRCLRHVLREKMRKTTEKPSVWDGRSMINMVNVLCCFFLKS